MGNSRKPLSLARPEVAVRIAPSAEWESIAQARREIGAYVDGYHALHMIAITRLRGQAPTRDYVARRITVGLSKREILRCLKRYIAREIYAALPPPPA